MAIGRITTVIPDLTFREAAIVRDRGGSGPLRSMAHMAIGRITTVIPDLTFREAAIVRDRGLMKRLAVPRLAGCRT